MSENIIIIDDILGGGATIQAVHDIIKNNHPEKNIYLWVAYNEGIHSGRFLEQFTGYFIGDEI